MQKFLSEERSVNLGARSWGYACGTRRKREKVLNNLSLMVIEEGRREERKGGKEGRKEGREGGNIWVDKGSEAKTIKQLCDYV
jgi:hypothetical protein